MMPSSQETDQLWIGRTQGKLDDITISLSESISLDKEIYLQDIRGSVAHSRMLYKAGILTQNELQKIEKALRAIQKEIQQGKFIYEARLEDIHTHIEKRLVELIGETGKKLHTGRSRNDQVAVDTHLYIRSSCYSLGQEVLHLCSILLERAKGEIDTLLPGYTHLQIAQPIRLSHHLLAYFWCFLRDVQSFTVAAETSNCLPLGSGAFAGVNYQTDRDLLQADLRFDSIYPNSMDAVSNRDHILDFLYAAAKCMTHSSRLAEEIVLWSSQEFSFLSLPDSLTTGSSIMPQKKNPDLAELIRGKTGRVQSNLQNLFVNLKSLPLAYNRDLQEDKLPMFDTNRQTLLCLQALQSMMEKAVYHRENMLVSLNKGFAVATDIADSLVKEKKIPFREAHHIVGKLVSYCIVQKKQLNELTPKERLSISSYLKEDSFYQKASDLKESTEKKISYGGTSLSQQKKQIQEATRSLQKWKKYQWNPPNYSF